MKTHPIYFMQHAHACTECGRVFYLCSDRDCDLAPQVCQGCEMDRQDAYLNTLEFNSTQQEPAHGHQQSVPVNLPESR